MAGKARARLERQFDQLQRKFPIAAGALSWLRRPSSRIFRIPLAVLLIFGGIFSILPGLGIWMLPLGLLLLAIDLPALRAPVSSAILRFQRWWAVWRRKGDK